jgi:hypothetical protein
MASTNVVKEFDRKSLSVASETHARVAKLIREMSYEREVTLNQDDIIKEALDALEAQRNGNK